MKHAGFAATVAIVAALFFAVSGARSGSQREPASGPRAHNPLLGHFQPFVIDISQTVPVAVSVPIEADGITATVPLTISVDLRVHVDGPQQVTVELLDAPPPKVAIATATPRPLATGPSSIVLDDVDWRVANAWDMGQTFDYMGDNSDETSEHTQARFVVVQFDVTNNGAAPVELSRFTSSWGDNPIQLLDDQRRRFGMFDLHWQWNESCDHNELNPGIGVACYVVFELPANVSGLSLQFAGDTDQQSLPVDLQPYTD